MINQKYVKRIINVFGKEAQKNKAVEELIELAELIIKENNGRLDYDTNLNIEKIRIDQIAEEIADVYIMLDQVKEIYGINNEEVERKVAVKLERIMKYVRNSEHFDKHYDDFKHEHESSTK